jgi:hypothetical protein
MKSLVGYSVVVLAMLVALLHPSQLESANLTSVKDTLSTSRISAHARLDSTGNALGSSHVQIKTSSSDPSFTTSTAGFKAGDTLTIGSSTADYYTIIDIIDANEFTVSPVLKPPISKRMILFTTIKPLIRSPSPLYRRCQWVFPDPSPRRL